MYFKGGVSTDAGATLRWLLPDSEPYHAERYAEGDFSYKIPFTKKGKFTLVLKFSEVYFQSSGEKVFDVDFGTSRIISNLDIHDIVGSRTLPFDEFIEFEIKDDKVYLEVSTFKNNCMIRGNKQTKHQLMENFNFSSSKEELTTPKSMLFSLQKVAARTLITIVIKSIQKLFESFQRSKANRQQLSKTKT